MGVAAVIQGIGSIGLFSSRAFAPAFVVALICRFGDQWSFLRDSPVVQSLTDVPPWFVHDVVLWILGVLTFLEFLATKNPEIADLLIEVDAWLKTVVGTFTFLGLTDPESMAVINTFVAAGLGAPHLFALFVASGIYAVTVFKNGILRWIAELDADDDSGVRTLTSLAEDSWAVFGTLLLVLYPAVLVVLFAAGSGALFLVRRHLQAREERSKIPCASCGASLYPSAPACSSCKTPVAAPRDVGVFGQSKPDATADPESHPLKLMERLRCPTCAARLQHRAVQQQCADCQQKLLKSTADVDAYLAHLDRKLPHTLAVTAGLSLLPVVGAVPGMLYYRLQLLAPLRRYLSAGRRFLLRWGLRLLALGMVFLQVVPLIGGAALPLLALVSYRVYRGAYREAAMDAASDSA